MKISLLTCGVNLALGFGFVTRWPNLVECSLLPLKSNANIFCSFHENHTSSLGVFEKNLSHRFVWFSKSLKILGNEVLWFQKFEKTEDLKKKNSNNCPTLDHYLVLASFLVWVLNSKGSSSSYY